MLEQDLTEATQLLQAARQLEAMAAAELQAAARDAAKADEAMGGAGVVAAEAIWLLRRATNILEHEQALGPASPTCTRSLTLAMEQEARAMAAYVATVETAAEAHEAARVARAEASQASLDVRRAEAKLSSLLTILAARGRSHP